MKLIVNPHKIEIEKSPVNEKEINITKVEFEFAEEITEDYVKEAYFTLNGNSYKQIIINNQCDIPYEVLNKQGQVEIGVVAYLVENEEEIKRYNPSPVYISTLVGSLKEDFENSELVTPSDKEQMEQMLQDGLNDIAEAVENAERLDVDVNKEETTTTITITKQDRTTKEVEVDDGVDGEDGVSLEYNWVGTSLGIKREDEQNYNYVNLKGDKGEPGEIKFTIVNELPLVGDEGTIYLVPYETITVQELPSTGNADTIYIVEGTNKRYVYESGQWTEITSDNKYIEYIYANNQWEELGGISVDVDLSNYYTKQEVNNLIPTQLSELSDDSTHRTVTDTEKTTWNNKSNFSGNYNDLTNKPTIPTLTSQLTNDSDFTTKTYVDGLVGDINTALDTINGEVL